MFPSTLKRTKRNALSLLLLVAILRRRPAGHMEASCEKRCLRNVQLKRQYGALIYGKRGKKRT